ncbi:MAG: ROK family protein [Clostridia bacterium]|nr:ROK family protein [Clostridia bacterium]
MYTIGIDLGGTNIAVGLCDESLNIKDKISAPTGASRAPEMIVKDMAALAKKLIDRNHISGDDVAYVGIATPGTVDPRAGVVEYNNNIRMKNFPIVETFRKYMPVPKVYVENDANAAALGEALVGSGRGSDSLIMITLGTGVGGGIVIDGRIFSGSVNTSGAELGHTVIVAGGRQCTCGRRGCLEAYASATALTAITEEKMHELELKGIPSLLFEEQSREGRVSARTAFNAAARGDKYASALIEDYIGYLAEGVTNMINIFQPKILCIGGGVSGEGENLIRPLEERVSRDQYTRDSKKKTKVAVATLGNDAGIIGAAALGNTSSRQK